MPLCSALLDPAQIDIQACSCPCNARIAAILQSNAPHSFTTGLCPGASRSSSVFSSFMSRFDTPCAACSSSSYMLLWRIPCGPISNTGRPCAATGFVSEGLQEGRDAGVRHMHQRR